MADKPSVLTALDEDLSIRVLNQIPTPVMAVDKDMGEHLAAQGMA